jgi:F-type H+-transporting ATPase subunit a
MMPSQNKLTLLALVLGVLLLASTGSALAQHDEHSQDKQDSEHQLTDEERQKLEKQRALDPHARTLNPQADEDARRAASHRAMTGGDTTDAHGAPTHGDEAHEADSHGDDAHGDAHGAAAHGDGHGDGHGDDHGGHSNIPHLQNFVVGWLGPLLPESIAHNLELFLNPIYAMTVALLLAVFFVNLSKKLSHRHPGRMQMAVEMIFGGLYSLFEAIIGPTARRYTPYLGTLFIFILANNLFGMLPLGHAATSSFNNTTFALGAMTFLLVQGVAIKENGILGYLHHLAGEPKTALDWGFSILLFPLHVLGELIKPLSLGLRLFGNIFGEETLVATMVILGYLLMKAIGGIVLAGDSAVWGFIPGIPLQLPFYFLGLLSSTIQALVFTLLSTVYIALFLPHGDHGHGEEAHGH